MKIKMKSMYVSSIVIAFFALNVAAQAQSLLVPGDPVGTARTDTYVGAGFGFFVPSGGTTTINAIGYWDQGGDGLLENHTVSLYQYSGSGSSYNLLATAVISAGTTDELVDDYRFVSIPTLTLTDNGQNGAYYVLAASDGGDEWTAGFGTDPTTALNPALGTFSSGVVLVGSGPTADLSLLSQTPIGINADPFGGYSGPNIAFIPASVPEPSAYGLLAGGLLMLALVNRMNRRSQSK